MSSDSDLRDTKEQQVHFNMYCHIGTLMLWIEAAA